MTVNQIKEKREKILLIIILLLFMGIMYWYLTLIKGDSDIEEAEQCISTEEFMNSLADGLQTRWDIEEYSEAHDISITYTEAVQMEMKFIDKYCSLDFEDDDLKDLFMHYYSALNMEYNAHDHTESYEDYIEAYNIGYEPAKYYLICFSDYYDLRNYINESYIDYYDKKLSQYRIEQ